MLYIGIDPGEAWCGFAALEATPDYTRVEARSYSIASHSGYLGMVRDIADLLPHAKRTHIVAEDFRIRRAGHQSFNAGNTLRMLGALEYAASDIKAFSFSLVSPNDHVEDMTRELYGRVLFNYRNHWPKSRHSSWRHCLSAWRVLGQYLLEQNPEVLLSLRKKKRSHPTPRWLPSIQHKHDRVAEAAWWITRRE